MESLTFDRPKGWNVLHVIDQSYSRRDKPERRALRD